ncbi:transposase [Streptomyces sp. HUAS ZL42]|uniref:transposase n=1 Tax=Streptomyces sp. HUAS ZL42 TaxID=3231715 RepID=UPI00345E4532
MISRRLPGCAMSANHDARLPIAALQMAAATRCGDVRGVIFAATAAANTARGSSAAPAVGVRGINEHADDGPRHPPPLGPGVPERGERMRQDRAALTAYLRFPIEHHKRIRNSNFIERAFGETRRRVKVIGRFPAETSAMCSRCSTGQPSAGAGSP